MRTIIESNGDGSWNKATQTDDSSSATTNSDNPFQGMPTARDAKSIPPSLAAAFNKINEHAIDGITYRFREVSFLELLSLGTNPFLNDVVSSLGKDDELDTEQYVTSLTSRDPEELEKMVEDAKIHRDTVLLHSLEEMSAGDDKMEITAEVIATMKEDVKDALYSIISGEGTAETNAVRRFPEGDGQDAGGDGIPDGD